MNPFLTFEDAIDRHDGEIVFVGTTVPVDRLWFYLEQGWGYEALLDDYPEVSRFAVELTLAYWPKRPGPTSRTE